ncbi:MAG: hypothetical protein COA79_01250 [Planctomycetota bacterium]|nr:MAG: hypothetical protein COA79_01250 [Planctomycetota bacterium]
MRFFLINSLITIALLALISCGSSSSSKSTTTDVSSNNESSETTTSISTEKFTPPTGACSTANLDSPCPRRILLATSTDGINFTRSGTVLSDQANTPNMIVLPNGRIIIYYTGSNLDTSNAASPIDAIAAAVSDDNGSTWTYYKTEMTGFGDGAPIVDPDIVYLEDGTFRMFVTRGIDENGSSKIGILYADSTDGFKFEYGGISATTDNNIVDSLTYKIGSTYHMHILNPEGSGGFAYFTSSDGKSFNFVNETQHNIGAETYILSNWLPLDAGGYRIYGFNLVNNDIRSFTTTDGATLSAGSDVHLAFADDTTGLEKTWVKDAAVAKLANGTYLMAYVAEIP